MSTAASLKMTPRMKRACALHAQGSSFEEIAAALSVSVQKAIKYVAMGGLAAQRAVIPAPSAGTVTAKGQTDEPGFDRAQFMKLAAEVGLPSRVANGLAQRLLVQAGGVPGEPRILKGQEVADAMRARLSMAMEYLDHYAMANSSGKDLALIIAILTDKMQLIEGKPTALYDIQVTHKLQTMMPAFIAEAKRRGITLDVTPERIAEELKP